MKITNPRRAAFVNVRALIASLLCLTAAGVTLLAVSPAQQTDEKRQTTASSRWFARLASSLGITGASQSSGAYAARASGGAIKTDKYPAEPPLPSTQTAPAVPYSDPPQALTPVRPVRTANLRDMRPIDPTKVAKFYHPEPVRPPLPAHRGTSAGPIQTAPGAQASAPTATGVNFEGIGVGLGGFMPSGNPPDVNGRVGPTQFVQWNNTSFAVFNKTTGALEYGPAAGNTLFQSLGGVCAEHNDGDPVVSYDILAGRWVISQFAVGGPTTSGYSHQCIAVSTTEDATGEYYVYDFVTDQVNFVDYPHTGVWPDGYYMSAHVFSATPIEVHPPVAPPGAFLEGRIYVFERQKMINGQPARMQSANLPAEFGFLPADLDSLTPPPAGEPEFVIGPNFVNTIQTDTFRVMVTWDPAPAIVPTAGTPILDGIDNAPCVSGQNSPARDCVPEPSPAAPTDYLDNLSGHYMYRLAYRNQGTQAAADESLVVSGTTLGSEPNHGAPRWFEFRNTGSNTATPTLFQAGTYDPDTNYRWMPSIAMDKDRNMALGYSKSSTTTKPSIYVTGRLAADTAGTMGAELEMQAGIGVQQGGGNRWGDYTAMTLDPIDQCTFYYTNEYLKTDGAFNWSTRIAAFKFPTCQSAAGLYGLVTGKITSAETGAPISGVRVALDNGYAGASDDNGVYTIIVLAGSYTATAADPARNCASAAPATAPVALQGGATITQDFAMTGTSKIEANGFTIDDSLGNRNGIVNRAECVKLQLNVKNNGCATEKAISAKLTTKTAGVTVTDGDSTYPDMAIDENATNAKAFKISVADSFVCGTDVALSLDLTYASGTKSIPFTIPTCAGGPDQTIPQSQLMTSDSTQNDRIGRDGRPSTCAGKLSPGGGFTGTHYYKTFKFTNTSGGARCYTVTINAGLNGPGDIESVAYDKTYDPTNLDTNYLGDSGITGLGTTVDHATYSFTVPAGDDFIVVVNTTGSNTSGTVASSQFSGTVSGFIDNTAGPGACAAGPSPTATASPTPSPSPTPSSSPTPSPSPSPGPSPTPSASPSASQSPSATPSPTASPSATETVSPSPTPTPTATATPAQLLNISTRAQVLTGDNVPIGGFIITGQQSKRVLLLAKGPSLEANGSPVPGHISDPVLELHDEGGALLQTNDDWKDSPDQQQIQDSGLAPTDDRESAIIGTFAPGQYTGIMSGKNGETGVGLVEVYDLDTTVDSVLANISTRGVVGTENNVMIGGFIAGNNSGETKVLIRGIGPSLADKVADALADPVLELHDSNGALLATNDNWKDSPDRDAIQATAIPPSNDLESAILYSVSKAGYTAILRGNNGTGVALVEIYDLR